MLNYPLRNRGGMLLGFVIVIFLIALALAGGIWYQLHQPTSVGPTPTPSPVSGGNVLNPTIVIDEELLNKEGELQTNLIDRLRQHYATQDDRLLHIAVTAIEHDSYQAKVSLVIVPRNGNERTLSFLYDLTPWNPSMLDNNE